MSAYIFFCSNTTEVECFRRNLFGGTEDYALKIKHVEIDDALYLYNYQTKMLHGEFTALSKSDWDLVPEAWDGRYRWQVKINRIDEYPPLHRSEFESLLAFNAKGYPSCKAYFISIIGTTQKIRFFESDDKRSDRLPCCKCPYNPYY